LRARTCSSRLRCLWLSSTWLMWPCVRRRCAGRARSGLLAWDLRTKRLLRRGAHGRLCCRRCCWGSRTRCRGCRRGRRGRRFSRRGNCRSRSCRGYGRNNMRGRRCGLCRCWGGGCGCNWNGSWGRRCNRLWHDWRMRRRSSRRRRLAQRGLGRRFFRGALGLRGGFGVGYALQMAFHLFGDIGGNRT